MGKLVAGKLRRRHKKIAFSSIILTVIFILIAIIAVVPFIWMFMISFKSPMEIMKNPSAFFPNSFTYLENYKYILSSSYGILGQYVNSIKVTGICVVGGIATSALAGYAFARLNFKGRDVIFLIYLATLIIPPQVTIIPRYIIFDNLGMIDTHLSLILPGIFSVIGTFLMRQTFMQIPSELSEAARIDGAGEYRIFGQVIFPLARGAMLAVLILNFSWHWNDYQAPLVFLRSASKYTLPLGMNVFSDINSDYIYYIATAGVLTCFPVIIVFLLAQKHCIKGIMAGALKG